MEDHLSIRESMRHCLSHFETQCQTVSSTPYVFLKLDTLYWVNRLGELRLRASMSPPYFACERRCRKGSRGDISKNRR